MNTFKYAIAYNKNVSHSVVIKDEISGILKKAGADFKSFDIDHMESGYDFVFVVGGDGTILKAARFYSKSSTPVFGVNLGRLGFLSQCTADDINDSITKILEGKYSVENRIMLEFGDYTALNDFVIKSSLSGRTSKFSLKINGKNVCDYLADGIIISTPTGSTAYGLSAGGPVIVPSLDVFVIVPICPHTLTARPLVVPDTEIITICANEDSEGYFFSADGQEFLQVNSEINVSKSNNKVKLALLNGSEFYTVLRDKLHWGISPAKLLN